VIRDPARPNKLFPFCSERCHLVDLGRWLGEDYRIAGPPAHTMLPGTDED
jgi:hypothetical protein